MAIELISVNLNSFQAAINVVQNLSICYIWFIIFFVTAFVALIFNFVKGNTNLLT